MTKSPMVALVLIVLLLVGLGPMLTIWSLNLLFGLTIALTFKTWFAAAWLGGLVSGGFRRQKD